MNTECTNCTADWENGACGDCNEAFEKYMVVATGSKHYIKRDVQEAAKTAFAAGQSASAARIEELEKRVQSLDDTAILFRNTAENYAEIINKKKARIAELETDNKELSEAVNVQNSTIVDIGTERNELLADCTAMAHALNIGVHATYVGTAGTHCACAACIIAGKYK